MFKRNEYLEKDITHFFSHEVEHYLDELLQQTFKRTSLTKERDGALLINSFIDVIKETDLSQSTLPEALSMVASWKKDFTKRILLPKYLSANSAVSLEEVTELIKKVILAAALNKKIAYYKQMCQNKLFKALQNIEPAKRLLPAKHIVSTSVKSFEESDASFPKDKFLSTFQQEALKEFLSTIPFKPSIPLSSQELEEKIQSYVEEKLANGPSTLTAQLHVVNTLLVELKKKSSSFFEELQIGEESSLILLHSLLKIKGALLGKACFDEINRTKLGAPYSDFALVREKIVKKYSSYYIYKNDPNEKLLKEHFLKTLKEHESTLQKYNPIEKELHPQPQKPKRTSFWKRI